MGLGSLLHDITNGVTLGGMDMSILSTISLPDPEAQLKYEAMGLPDPIAFAALTALGAIPNPMVMINAMMLNAEKRIEAEAAASTSASTCDAAVQPAPPAGSDTDNYGTGSSGASDVPRPELPPVKFKLPGMAEGKSFVEAFKEMEKSKEAQHTAQLDESKSAGPTSGYIAAAQRLLGEQEERLAKQAKEAAEQAKVAAERAREVAQGAAQSAALGAVTASGMMADAKGVAQVFYSGADEDTSAARLAVGSLSALLMGSQPVVDGPATGVSTADKICISGLPKGVTDSAVRLECARHGAVTSVVMQGDGAAAYVTYANAEMASNAMRRIVGRPGALGGLDPVEVRLVAEIPENVRMAPVVLSPEAAQDPSESSQLPEYLRKKEDRKKEKRSRSRQKSRSRSRRKKRSSSRTKKRRRSRKRSKSRDRWLDRSRSHSHTATGQYIRATGCTSTVRPWEKKKSSSSSRSRSKSLPRREPATDDKRPRQVAVKGSWAHLIFKGSSYYYSILTGQTQWDRPKDFDKVPANHGQQASKTASGCLL